MGQAVFGLLGAMVGAGFASGREIAHFFSRWGAFSWPLILGAGLLMAALMERAMARDPFQAGREAGGVFFRLSQWLLLALLVAAGGGMTAAAGELAALTLPLRHARATGALLTLGVCLALSRRPLRALSALGRLLTPGLALALLACILTNDGAEPPPAVSAASLPLAAFQAAGYAGLNVTLAYGVLRDAGAARRAREKRKIAWITAALFAGLLGLSNAALLPRMNTLRTAVLPTVLLLRRFGKTGYYAAAALLYLAVASTLLSVLRGITALLPGRRRVAWAGLLAAGASLLGFDGLVSAAYPMLGLLSLLFLLAPQPNTSPAR